MADPVIVSLPKDTWIEVANAVKIGSLWNRSLKAHHIVMTSRDTGGGGPINNDDAVRVFNNGNNFLPISSSIDIDVYLQSLDDDGEIVAVL